MIFVEAQQGTPEWYAARCGKITASCFADAVSVMTKNSANRKVGEPTAVAQRYAADLAIERISGAPHGEPAKAWVLERGHEMETRARMLYEARTGAFITESGICLSDDGIFGYSSDGLADDDGLIEIKAPIDSIKIMDMWRTGDTSEYDHQMQGGLWLTARKWVDFIMYVPDLAAAGKDLFVKRIYRDEAFIDKMVQQLADFDKLVNSYTAVLRADTMPTTTEKIMTETAPAPEPQPEQEAAAAVSSPAVADAMIAEVKGTLISAKMEVPDARIEPSIGLPPHYPLTPTLKLGDISARLKFTVTADFLLSLGFAPAATEKNSKLFHESSFKKICSAIVEHLNKISEDF